MTLFSRLLESRVTTYQQVFASDSDNPASPFNYERAVTRDKALGLSAVFACVRMLSDTVSTLPLNVYERQGGSRVPVTAPDWIDRPIPRDPSVTRVVHLQQVVSSLLLDGNAFILAMPSVYEPAELRVLDPRSVEVHRHPDSSPYYVVRGTRDQISGEFDATQMIHIPLIRLAGEPRGVSPLEAERRLFAGAIATEQLAAQFSQNGLWLSAVVESPAGVSYTEEQAEDLIRKIERKYSGSRNAGRIGLLTGGATIKPLSITPEQAQFLQTRQYDDERIFRLYRCPPALVGMLVAGSASHSSAISQALAFEKHTIRPLVEQIEAPYSALAGPGRYVKFDTKGLLRGDPLTQAQIYHYALTDQWQTRGEVRDDEDKPRFDDEAENGFLETPNNNAPSPDTNGSQAA